MTTFAGMLSTHARRQPAKLAVVAGDTRLTYAELDARVGRVATNLARAGVDGGAVVSSQLSNCTEAVVVALAANRVGGVHNPIATIAGARELDFVLEQADSRVFIDRPDHELLHIDEADEPASVAPGAPRAVPRFLVYTSGSTAEPKGVLHSDTTLLDECRAQSDYHGLRNDEVFVMPSPVAHVSGLLYGIFLPLFLGATSVLLARWDPTEFLVAIERERGTFSGGATPFLQGAADHPDVERFDLTSFRLFPCGGADVPPDLIRRAQMRLGVRTGRGYGSTEFPSITSSAGPDHTDDERAETDGRPIGANRVRVVDGEVEAIGPELFLGYLDASLDTDAFTSDGWLRTGDLGAIDDQGSLTITGRAKDVVIRHGEKIPAKEVETVVGRHPAVAEVAIVALADPRTGERACACIVLTPGSSAPTLAELAEFCTARGLATRRLPEQIEIVPSMLRTPGGKIDKRALLRTVEGIRR
jgi:cyclohexanecarboxylate-CoA ligase